jgi:hypothetical protein
MPKVKKKCTPCLGSALKAALIAAVKDTGTKAVITEMPECDDALAADFCYLPRGKMGGGKKAKSAYTEFASKCMKEKNGKGKSAPEVMKGCALEWKQKGKLATAPQPSLASSLQPL